MSPVFLRNWYHSSGNCAERTASAALNVICDSPGRECERMNSYSPVSINFFSIRSVTCRATSSAVAPGHSVRITIALKVNGGSSDWPRRVYETIPAMLSNTMAYTTRPRLRSAHSDRLKRLMVCTPPRGDRTDGVEGKRGSVRV